LRKIGGKRQCRSILSKCLNNGYCWAMADLLAREITVAAGGQSLFAAIEHAPAGSKFYLLAGQHSGGFCMDRSASLRGENGATILAPRGAAALRIEDDGISFHADNITFSSGINSDGGGLCVRGGGSVRLRDCVFEGNRARRKGGGIFVNSGMLTLERCVFNGNYAAIAGALMLDGTAIADLSRCQFRSNRASIGGSVVVHEGAQAVFKLCSWLGNGSPDGAEVLRVSGSASRAPTVSLQFCDIDAGDLLSGPQFGGAVVIANSKLPSGWRDGPFEDRGGNTYGKS